MVLDGQILGKPRSTDDARRMLELFSGRTHSIITGVSLVRLPEIERRQFVETTLVHFAPLSRDEISRYLATEEWHHVRYTVPPLAMTMAAGLIGYSRLSAWLAPRRGGWFALALVWILAVLSFSAGLSKMADRMARIPQPISLQEAEAINYWISQVGPSDGVLATYEVTAPLSSRRRLFSYILDQNKPKGFPKLGPEFSWAFVRSKEFDPTVFLDQGFEIVHMGDFLTIFRRG